MRRIVSLFIVLLFVGAMLFAACEGRRNTDKVNADDYLLKVPPVQDLTDTDTSKIIGLEDGVLTVGMECAYAPYNWTQTDASYGAVPISNVSGAYANG